MLSLRNCHWILNQRPKRFWSKLLQVFVKSWSLIRLEVSYDSVILKLRTLVQSLIYWIWKKLSSTKPYERIYMILLLKQRFKPKTGFFPHWVWILVQGKRILWTLRYSLIKPSQILPLEMDLVRFFRHAWLIWMILSAFISTFSFPNSVLASINNPKSIDNTNRMPFPVLNMIITFSGVKFMFESVFESKSQVEKDKVPGGAILAHCMGLGKTLQVWMFCLKWKIKDCFEMKLTA